MTSPHAGVSIGVDFGTSNTVVALAHADGRVEALRFEHAGVASNVYPTCLCFWQEQRGLPPSVEGGPWAIQRLIEHESPLRFLQSFKTLAASRSFQSTTIFTQRYAFEDMLAAFLRTLMRHAGAEFDLASARVTIGRPVKFAGAHPDETLAMQRYREGFGRLGAASARYVYEPVGAAFSFARGLERDATVLVADFGGGTSDFSILRFSRHGGALRAQALGHAGLGLAGDNFDARIVEHAVAKHFGKGGSYRSFGKTLPLPSRYFSKLAHWHELALMKGAGDLKELRELARDALKPAPLEAFIELVEHDLGFALYRAVSGAKVALSSVDRTELRFAGGDIAFAETIRRADFERWIAPDLARIGATVDSALAQAKLAANEIERVFLTGGTSFTPAVQQLFAQKFGGAKFASGDQFESIAYGLALIGRSEEPDQWAA